MSGYKIKLSYWKPDMMNYFMKWPLCIIMNKFTCERQLWYGDSKMTKETSLLPNFVGRGYTHFSPVACLTEIGSVGDSAGIWCGLNKVSFKCKLACQIWPYINIDFRCSFDYWNKSEV